MNIKTKLLTAGTSIIAPMAVLAEDYDPTTAINDIRDQLTGWISSIAPAMVTIVVAGLVIWFIPRLARYLKSAFGGGTGR